MEQHTYAIRYQVNEYQPKWFVDHDGVPYIWDLWINDDGSVGGDLQRAKMTFHNVERADWYEYKWIILTEVDDDGEPCGEPVLRWDRPTE